jgi:hypothetical protein
MLNMQKFINITFLASAYLCLIAILCKKKNILKKFFFSFLLQFVSRDSHPSVGSELPELKFEPSIFGGKYETHATRSVEAGIANHIIFILNIAINIE